MLRKRGAVIAICAITAVVFAGCGSSSPNRPAATAAVPARGTPLMSNPDIGEGTQQGAHPAAAIGQLPSHGPAAAGTDTSHITTAKVVQARQTPSVSEDEQSAGHSKPLNPCTLVSLSQAQNITQGAITKVIEAPLGPTCIYSGAGRTAGVTLAVESENFNQVTRLMSVRKHIVISGHRSVCGRLGKPILLVPLDRYTLLNVSAPCGIAQRFAALAVGRLAA
jgi:hypothetical protein